MFQKRLYLIPYFLISLLPFSCFAELDKNKYITIDEIAPGMDAVCLTVYKGVEPEKFSLKVVDVVRNIRPGRNAILVMGTDERFIHTGPVAGCSGSPVYINGRLAGALAFGWMLSKDPLYGVTPIEEMLQAGTCNSESRPSAACAASEGPVLDFSKPIDLKAAYDQTINFRNPSSSSTGRITILPCPLATTLPQSSFSPFAGIFESAGLLPVSAGGSGTFTQYTDTKMEPGGTIALPLVYGDIELSAIGTVTEVADGKVYAFGHSFLGQGPIDVPFATGYIHTVVASVLRSFKFGQSIDIKGALYADESAAIVGAIGKKAATIPMNITVERFNDEKTRTYNCQIISHRYYTPLLAGVCLSGTATMLGDIPADHTIQYKTNIGIEGYDSIHMENFSSSADLVECLADNIGAISLVMNNPYDRPQISSLDFEIKILPKTAVSRIWNFEVSDTTVKPGRTITAKITLESYLASNKTYKTEIKIPQNIPPGEYSLIASGAADYRQFSTALAPYRYEPENMPDLIKIINDIANTKRNNLYITLMLPADGITIEKSELPQLPLTKAMLLNNEKRSVPALPATEWRSQTIPVDSIVLDSRSFKITVKKD
ncbi:MAG: hypothetical protein KKE31_04405 [Planctomycetes bacterium]|nr:hypothetical protein [Planctomycetota bacterium]MBU1517730.1 hypothetical protein [Planctomycetota bacterium]MBU2457854.1 hypothetical protein [Planctomycetota bacterium]